MSRYSCIAWVGGALLKVWRPCLLSHYADPMLFILNSMSKTYIQIGTYNDNSQDHHKEMTVNVSGNTSVNDLVRSFFADDVEEVKTEPAEESSDMPFLVVEKLKELNLYTLEEFEDKYREAVKGDAKTLAKFLKDYSKLEVLDFQGKDKKQILTILQEYFPNDITYGYTNFATYF